MPLLALGSHVRWMLTRPEGSRTLGAISRPSMHKTLFSAHFSFAASVRLHSSAGSVERARGTASEELHTQHSADKARMLQSKLATKNVEL
jgi:hypothetical protein